MFWPWKTVYDYFRRWSRQGVWSQVLDRLTRRERRLNGPGGEAVGGAELIVRRSRRQPKVQPPGMTAGKKIQGRKRHLLVDTSGLLRQVVVTAADVDDREGLKQMLTRLGASA